MSGDFWTVTLGNPPNLDADERRQRAMRAREVLDGAGWLFDDHISELVREFLGTHPDNAKKREQLHFQIDAAAQVKGHLVRIIQLHQAEVEANERKARRQQSADE